MTSGTINDIAPSQTWYLPISRYSLAGLSLVVAVLYVTSLHSFLLFHSLVELFSILVFFGIFVIAWNARHIIKSHFLLFLGIAYLFVGVMDLEHSLSYKGMDLLGSWSNANHATQLWIAARYTQSLALLAAPFFLQHRIRPRLVLVLFFLVSGILLWAIHAGAFPVCFVEGRGLTPFKIISEYVIALILVASFVELRRRRRLLNAGVFRLVAASILFTIASELAFTSYVSVFGPANLLGHFFKFVAAYLIYVAIIETGLKTPYALLFHELKSNEEILSAREAEFRSIFELSAAGMAKLDPESGRFVLVNRKLSEITGYTMEELQQMHADDLTHPDDVQRDTEMFAKYLRGETPDFRIEKRYIRKDGEVIWVRVTATLVRPEEGAPQYSVGIVEDITARRQDQELLRQSEEKFRLIAQSIKDVIWMGTPGIGKVLYVNPAYEKLWGRSRDSLYENPLSFRDAVHPHDLPLLQDAPRQHAEGKWQFNYRIVRPDGSVRWIEDSGSPIYDENGAIHSMVGVARDITARKLLEEHHRRRKEELEKEVGLRTAELARSISQLRCMALQIDEAENRERRRLADILHDDLQQLLAAANMHLEKLRGFVEDDQRGRLQVITDILNRAIKASRSLSHDLSPPILYRGSLNAVFEWLAAKKQDNHGLQTSIEMPPDLRIESDNLRVFLFRAVQELLFNVVKHAGVKEAALTVERNSPDELLVTVADRGRGFDPAMLPQVDCQAGAAGYGLMTIRERLQLLGGSLSVDSAPGRGSRFVIRLPLLGAEAGEIPSADFLAGDSSGSASPSNTVEEGARQLQKLRLRVLLADDHETIRQGLEALLKEEADLEVVGQAANGTEAVRLAGELRPDVVVMDVSMPEMDGIEATGRIAGQWPDIAVIVHSMHDDRELAEAALGAGARAFCAKSGSASRLLDAIRLHGLRQAGG